MSVDSHTIEELLKLRFLSAIEARERACVLADDIKKIRFSSFRLNCRPVRLPGETEDTPFAEYTFGQNQFDINKAKNATEDIATWLGGTGLNKGNLQFFSKVSEIGHRIIPDKWLKSRRLRDELRNPSQHLDALNEVWWLNRWHGPQNIEPNFPLNKNNGQDIDWRFTVAGGQFTINLEVKHRPSDALRHARNTGPDSLALFEKDVLSKFRPSQNDEINVLGLSLFGEIDDTIQRLAEEWLVNKQSLLDAILIWTMESRRRSPFDFQIKTEKAKLLKECFVKPLDDEDKSFIFLTEVPIEIEGFPQ